MLQRSLADVKRRVEPPAENPGFASWSEKLKVRRNIADSYREAASAPVMRGCNPIRGEHVSEALPKREFEQVMTATPSPAAAQPQRHVRTMDFARPSKFSKDQLRTLQMLHETFCRRMTTYLSGTVRSLCEVSVSGAEQVPYGDFIASLPVPNFTAVLEIAPHNTNAMASMEMPLLFGILDRMLGGPGTGSSVPSRELTDIETGLSSTLMERVLKELSSAWEELVPVEFRLRGVEMNAQFAQIASASEPSVLINIAISIGSASGTMSLCIPYRSIENIVGSLSAHRYFAMGEPPNSEDSKQRVLANLQQVTVPVRAVVGQVSVPVNSLLSIAPGDVVPLGRRVSDGLRLVVGDTKVHQAFPGRNGRYVAVRVGERISGSGS